MLEGLEIWHAPFGVEFVKAVAQFVETATNLKMLDICSTFAGESTGGRDCGICLAEAIANHQKIEKLVLYGTDLMGSRNAADWEEALKSNQSLKELTCCGA